MTTIDADPKRGFYGGGGLDARFDYYPAGFALAGMPSDMPQWGAEWKRAVGQYYTHIMAACWRMPVAWPWSRTASRSMTK